MEVTRERVLVMMGRVGLGEFVEEARRRLPDPVDIDRDGPQLAAFGLSIDSLTDRLGGSP